MTKPIHPGKVIRNEFINGIGISITDLSSAIGVSRKCVSELINEKFGISTEMAFRLGKALDTDPEYWINLQQRYDIEKTKYSIDLRNVKEIIRRIRIEK